MCLRVIVDDRLKKSLRDKLNKSQNLFYLSLFERSKSATDLLARSGSPSLDYCFEHTDHSIVLTQVEIELILADKFELFEYVRRLGRMRVLKPYLMEFKNEAFIDFLRQRLRVYALLTNNKTITYVDNEGVAILCDESRDLNSETYQKLFYKTVPDGCQMILGFEKLVEFVCRMIKNTGSHARVPEMIFGYNAIICDLIASCIRVLRPFEVLNFQILDFEDYMCSSGFAMINESRQVEERWFRYVLHVQDCATKFNFLLPLDNSSYVSVGNFMSFLFLTFREPKELIFDGIDTPECMHFIESLAQHLSVKITLQVGSIKFATGNMSLHLETLICSSMKFFNNRNWAPQLSVLCKILNNLRLYGTDAVNDDLTRYNPAQLLFNSCEELSELIGEAQLAQLLKLWEEHERQLEDSDDSIVEVGPSQPPTVNQYTNGHVNNNGYTDNRDSEVILEGMERKRRRQR
ncbi:hypothetical protein KL905_000998 [Ogataea polymorpha]|uniref:uncharacterized protein n=1 Tax=Ogataea polymorpha TaxID=460523 RepID=UPI0007F543ED|nr:uncharacterized protein OGAPODRAFT_76708 [Ogataea polymorpha]KAG7881518.1 hypothetical protein KL937_001141 [Ogataea polymorpha]KAG7891188.1 hypothetical protein KL908_003941 [Ogataea polymorpha]KAG7910283.1 hypothetical protein KL907_001174 [Ogataea polymorpha]KAG7918655.1 hypothetical protein KL927_002112 [Ogataea polymorpha]KAG7923780.1 hypothetical protein KL905_000998 [Ogataea polymorpha]